MKITYFTLQSIQIGDGWREPGDLVPEVATWSLIGSHIAQGTIAPVLVATLPQNVQDALAEYEAHGSFVPAGALAVADDSDDDDSEEADEPAEDDGDEDGDEEASEDDGDEDEDGDDGDDEDGDEDEAIDYNEFTVAELKAEIEARIGQGRAVVTEGHLKADLIAALEADDEAAADDNDD